MRQKMTFTNHHGIELAALLEKPEGEIRGHALFAHCFTCGKDINSASRIAKRLAEQGIVVLRFDFTGLGGSDGEFANTNFSSNLDDLVAAAEFMANHETLESPDLLIGHSLGGTAVLAVAEKIDTLKGVVTIGSPATPDHVLHNFAESLPEIESEGCATVNLANRPFTIKQQFIDDVKEHQQELTVRDLRKPLLIFHSPVDTVVSIEEAAKVYRWAMHPKSFVSLDKADHLLSKADDAQYVADTLANWADRYALKEQSEYKVKPAPSGQVRVTEVNHKFTRGIATDHHQWLADEPIKFGGQNLGPDPYEMLLASLGACTSMTVRVYANHNKLPLEDVEVVLEHTREHEPDCEDCNGGKLDVLTRRIRIEGDQLTQEQRERLVDIANRCPVHLTLENKIEVRTELVE